MRGRYGHPTGPYGLGPYGQNDVPGPGMPGGSVPPWPPTHENAQAALNPPSYQAYAEQIPAWYREPVYEPRPFFPNQDNIAKQPRMRTVESLNEAANVEVLRFIQVDVPSIVYAWTGAAVDTTPAALPVGLASLDTFTVRFEHNAGDRLTPVAQLGSCVLGTAAFPALIGGAGWVFDRGGTITVAIVPLRASLRIDVTAWIIEVRGPVNYNPTQ